MGGTNTPKELVSFTLGVVELDQEKHDDREYVRFDTAYDVLMRRGDRVRQRTEAGLERFESTDLGGATDNPSYTGPQRADCTPTTTNPYDCISDMQYARSLQVKYSNRQEFDLTIGHESDSERKGDRFLEFFGTTCADS